HWGAVRRGYPSVAIGAEEKARGWRLEGVAWVGLRAAGPGSRTSSRSRFGGHAVPPSNERRGRAFRVFQVGRKQCQGGFALEETETAEAAGQGSNVNPALELARGFEPDPKTEATAPGLLCPDRAGAWEPSGKNREGCWVFTPLLESLCRR